MSWPSTSDEFFQVLGCAAKVDFCFSWYLHFFLLALVLAQHPYRLVVVFCWFFQPWVCVFPSGIQLMWHYFSSHTGWLFFPPWHDGYSPPTTCASSGYWFKAFSPLHHAGHIFYCCCLSFCLQSCHGDQCKDLFILLLMLLHRLNVVFDFLPLTWSSCH